MRHRKASKKLSRNSSNRKALLRSLVSSLIEHERISTTYEKAKEASIVADRIITLGKRNTITTKKTAIQMLGSKLLLNKLFDEIAPRYSNRAGGYTRVMQCMPRKGDGAKMAILELTERRVEVKPETKKKEAKSVKAGAAKIAEKEKPVTAGEKPRATEPPKATPKPPKDKIPEEKKTKEKAKSEKDKQPKGFFKGLKRYFRGKA